MFILLTLLLPLVIGINAFAAYINSTFASRVAELNEVSLEGYVNRVSDILKTVSGTMTDMVGTDYNFRRLARQLPEVEAYNSAYDVHLTLKSAIASQENISGLILYSPLNDQYMPAWADNVATTEAKAEIRDFVVNWDQGKWNDRPSRWKMVEFDHTPYLCLSVYSQVVQQSTIQRVYLFCLIQLNKLGHTADRNAYFIYENQYITGTDLVVNNELPLPPADASYITAGSNDRYVIMSRPVSETSVDAVYLIPYDDIRAGSENFQLILLAISLCAIAFVPLGYSWVTRTLLHPVPDLVSTMEQAASGDLTVRAPEKYRDREFNTMALTFNNMLQQIQDLKIESYERELINRQTQLSFLQLQIRPHFYLNCLKNLYGMVQEQQYELIQDVLIVLSNYLRYMMSSNTSWVTLEEELQNSSNYIRLQQYNQAYPPTCTISVDKNTLHVKIPPITVLTFVENCIKHAAADKPLQISLRARMLPSETGQILLLTIADNGLGFSEDQLIKLNNMQTAKLDDKHIGINNVYQRLNLLYGDECGIVFSNNNGAVVEIFIPLNDQSGDQS
jgi:two-component system sensor histidine kinase YesM